MSYSKFAALIGARRRKNPDFIVSDDKTAAEFLQAAGFALDEAVPPLAQAKRVRSAAAQQLLRVSIKQVKPEIRQAGLDLLAAVGAEKDAKKAGKIFADASPMARTMAKVLTIRAGVVSGRGGGDEDDSASADVWFG